MMKHYYFYVMVLLVVSCGFFSCKKDNTVDWTGQDKTTPELNLTVSSIHSDQERSIELKGILTDDLGIQSVNLKDPEWFLDKTIQVYKDSLIKSYNLDYYFKVPKDALEKEHQIVITVTDMAGKTVSKTVKVYMDGDFNAPSSVLEGLSDGAILIPAPGDKFDLGLTCTDDRRLSYLVVKETSLGLYDSIPNLTGKTYSYANKNITIPQSKADYSFLVTLADSAGNITKRTIKTSVQINWDFPNMYLSDVSTVDELNSDLFGVPMVVDKTAAYSYTAVYFCSKANTEIKFLAQKTNFTPHCFGKDPERPTKLINNAATALPIVLPEVGYYKVVFNTDPADLSYSVQKIDPMSDANRPALYTGLLGIAGSGFLNAGGGWNPTDIAKYPSLQLIQDPTYKYRMTTTVSVSGTVEFTLTPPDGSWPTPFWRQDKDNPEKTVLNNGSNVKFIAPSQATTYLFTFDMYLNRMKMVKQ